MTGYLYPGYARSLAEFGRPRPLTQCGGWVLERPIPGVEDRDAISCYPLFCCRDWSKLHIDLDDIGGELVSLSVVTDPFGAYDEAYLLNCFKDKVIPFKKHFIVDLHQSVDDFLSSHHRRNVRKALHNVEVERCQEPLDSLDDWNELYHFLIRRHHIQGIQKFSEYSFQRQFENPGITVFRALQRKKTVGMLLWYRQKEVSYYHLGAYNPSGYESKASFALFWHSIQYFTEIGIRYLNLGAGAGLQSIKQDGLSRFKAGWSTGTKTAFFCGRIFNPERYSAITKSSGISGGDYFPAYREGEFI